ncbi:MAG: TIGR04255 family protein [Ramlibacter sp.]
MVAVRRLARPPIAEAVVNFQVQLRSPLDEELPARLPAEFKAKFPGASQLRRNELSLQFSKAGTRARQDDQLRGYRFENDTGNLVTVFDQQQFVFSHVNRYQSWEALIQDARSAWETYQSALAPAEVTRIGLRYINKCKLELPADSRQLLTTSPTLPEELGLDIGSFLSQITTELPCDALANVLQLLQHEAEASYAIIDVDVYRAGLAVPANSEDLWKTLDSFREWKNKIFFSLVTEKLLESYI